MSTRIYFRNETQASGLVYALKRGGTYFGVSEAGSFRVSKVFQKKALFLGIVGNKWMLLAKFEDSAAFRINNILYGMR